MIKCNVTEVSLQRDTVFSIEAELFYVLLHMISQGMLTIFSNGIHKDLSQYATRHKINRKTIFKDITDTVCITLPENAPLKDSLISSVVKSIRLISNLLLVNEVYP